MGDRVGEIINERYRLERLIEADERGEAYFASNIDTATAVVVRVLRPELARQPKAVETFRREARRREEAGLARSIERGSDDAGTPFLVESFDMRTVSEAPSRPPTRPPSRTPTPPPTPPPVPPDSRAPLRLSTSPQRRAPTPPPTPPSTPAPPHSSRPSGVLTSAAPRRASSGPARVSERARDPSSHFPDKAEVARQIRERMSSAPRHELHRPSWDVTRAEAVGMIDRYGSVEVDPEQPLYDPMAPAAFEAMDAGVDVGEDWGEADVGEVEPEAVGEAGRPQLTPEQLAALREIAKPVRQARDRRVEIGLFVVFLGVLLVATPLLHDPDLLGARMLLGAHLPMAAAALAVLAGVVALSLLARVEAVGHQVFTAINATFGLVTAVLGVRVGSILFGFGRLGDLAAAALPLVVSVLFFLLFVFAMTRAGPRFAHAPELATLFVLLALTSLAASHQVLKATLWGHGRGPLSAARVTKALSGRDVPEAGSPAALELLRQGEGRASPDPSDGHASAMRRSSGDR